MEAKLTDQEEQACRDNLRIHGIPEREEGNDICSFLEKLLSDMLDIPADTEIKIERAPKRPAAGETPLDYR